MGKLQIKILGTAFSAQANEDDEYLQKLLNYYREITDTIKKSGKLSDPLKISILAGISLVDELYKEKQLNARLNSENPQNEKHDSEVMRLTEEMINKITEAVE